MSFHLNDYFGGGEVLSLAPDALDVQLLNAVCYFINRCFDLISQSDPLRPAAGVVRGAVIGERLRPDPDQQAERKLNTAAAFSACVCRVLFRTLSCAQK